MKALLISAPPKGQHTLDTKHEKKHLKKKEGFSSVISDGPQSYSPSEQIQFIISLRYFRNMHTL